MPTVSVKSDLLSPSASKTIEYVGTNPALIYKIIPDILLDTFRIGTSKIWEDEIKWDVTSEPTVFYGYWRAKQKIDSFTTNWIHVEVKGKQYKDKTGECKIKMKGTMTTKFNYNNPMMRAIFWLYRMTFYRDRKNTYLNDAVKDMDNLDNALRVQFDIMRKSR
jgi:hypothetical protein